MKLVEFRSPASNEAAKHYYAELEAMERERIRPRLNKKVSGLAIPSLLSFPL